MTRNHGYLDLFDSEPLTLTDDPEIDLMDLLTVAPIGRHNPPTNHHKPGRLDQ